MDQTVIFPIFVVSLVHYANRRYASYLIWIFQHLSDPQVIVGSIRRRCDVFTKQFN